MMGFAPNQVRSFTIHEFQAATDGFAELRGGAQKIEPLTRSDLESMINQYPDEN